MNTKKQFQLTLKRENDKSNLCELLDKELSSWFEFYEGNYTEIVLLEYYTEFQLLKQMDWPLDDEIELINEAKKKVAALQKEEKPFTKNTLDKLEIVLDVLCELADRQITVFLPTNQEEQIPYIKKEIINTLEKIK